MAQYFTQLNGYHVVLEGAARAAGDRPSCSTSIYLLSPLTGKTVPLSLFVKVEPERDQQPDRSATRASLPAATISFNLAPGVSLGQATAGGASRRATSSARRSP